MPLVLSNEEVESLLTMPVCLEALEEAYGDWGREEAVNRPRSDTYVSTASPDTYYIFKSMEGAARRSGVFALRICSDTISWYRVNGKLRKEKLPVLPGNRWLGLVFLFSIDNGEPLAILADGFLQKSRVGGSNALGVKYLSRSDSRVAGLLGSGWQATSHLESLCLVRRLDRVRVYSPSREHREAFAARMAPRVGVEVVPVPSAREAVEGSDVVLTTTNSIEPVLDSAWIAPGMHLGCVKHSELGPASLSRCDRIVVNSRAAAPENYIMGKGDGRIAGHDPLFTRQPEDQQGIDWEHLPHLGELIVGKASGRANAADVTCFLNNMGIGIQFAAVGARVLALARRKGVGREVPLDWFLQKVPLSTAKD